MLARTLFALFLVHSFACSDSDGGGPGQQPEPIRLTVDPESGAIALRRGDRALLRLPPDGFSVGVVAEIDPGQTYDPFYLPEDVDWRRSTSLQVRGAGVDDAALPATIDIAYGEGIAGVVDVVPADETGERFTLSWRAPTTADGHVAWYRLDARIDAEEGLYGLGGVLDTPNHRGKHRAMQLEADFTVESAFNERHVKVPLLTGTTGWGLFVEDPSLMTFDCAASAADRVRIVVGKGARATEGVRIHLYGAQHPLDITRHYFATTGTPRLPARWALGPVVWRDENDDQAQVESDVQTMRDLDLPASAYWIDRPYASGINTFDFRPDRYPDPAAMVRKAQDLGFRMGLWHTPYVNDEEAAERHDFALAQGYFPETDFPTFAWSLPLDLTNPAAYAWWQEQLAAYVDLGFEGFKLDFAEDIVPGIGDRRIPWAFHDGTDELTQHSRYQLLYHQAYAELLPEDGGLLLCRTGTYGDQVNGCIIWPGDKDATLDLHGVETQKDGERYTATGGLPATLVYGLSLGPAGYAFYGSDTGGYRHSPPNKETFVRWFQQTALSSVMQIGTSSSDVAWEFNEKNGFDDESLDLYRQFTRLHLRLWPYLWTHAELLPETGRPLMRAYGLARPDLGIHPSDVYFLGDDLLVAPVMTAGAVTREVPLPPGRWIHWFTGEVFEATSDGEPTRVTVDAPLPSLPLFLRAGGMIPLLRPTIDTLSPTTVSDEVDSYATTPGRLHVRVFPGAETDFVLFDGTRLTQKTAADRITLEVKRGAEFTGQVRFELVGEARPKSVTTEGALVDEQGLDSATGPAWRQEGGRLDIELPSGVDRVIVRR